MIVRPSLSKRLEHGSHTELCNRTTEVGKTIRSIVPFFRGWCIYEIFFAMITDGVTVIVKCGGHVSEELSLSNHKAPHIFRDDSKGILRIAALIDIERADFSQPTDKQLILGKACGYPDGLYGLNMTVKRKLGGAYFSSPYPLVHTFACQGGEDVRQFIIENAEKHVIGVAAEGCTTLLEEMLCSNQSLVRVVDLMDRTPLMAAAAGGQLPCLQIIVGTGVLLDLVDKSGLSALHFGAIFCSSSSLTFLLSLKIDARIDFKDSNGMTALMLAAMGGYLPCVEVLVNSGANVNTIDTDGCTALMLAAMKGHLSCVEVLVNSGANVNAMDTNGMTALTHAAAGGHLSCVEFWTTSGADVNAKNTDDDFTALMHAALEGHLSCVEVLVNSGANVNAKNTKSMTALMFASVEGHLSCVEVLVNSGADVNAKNTKSMTALMFASVEGHLSCVEVLVNSGADVNAKKTDGKTALMHAAEENHISCVEFLVKRGAL